MHLLAKFFPGQCNGHMYVAICCSIRRSCGHGGECNLHVRVGFASHTPAKKKVNISLVPWGPILVQKFAPLNAPLKPPLNILLFNFDEKFSKELSKEHSKEQNFCTRIGPLGFASGKNIDPAGYYD